MHRLNKDFFGNIRSQNIELPYTLSQEVTGECALPNEDLNQGKEGHRMWKTGDPACARDGRNP